MNADGCFPVAAGTQGDMLRRLLREHAPDDARCELAERVVQHLEGSGFELDEQSPAPYDNPKSLRLDQGQCLRLLGSQVAVADVA